MDPHGMSEGLLQGVRRAAVCARAWSLLAALGALAAAGSCGTNRGRTPRFRPLGTGQAVVVSRLSAAELRVEPAAPATRAHAHSLVARVAFDERHLAVIGPPVQGRVASVNVVTGDRVQRGDVLLTIHAPDIASAEAQVRGSRSARIYAQETAARASRLSAEHAGSDAERQQAETALLQARTEEHRAQAALAALGGAARGASDYELRAPITGTVVERNVWTGTEVSVGQDDPVLRIADLATVWVVADVYEQDLPGVHVGDEAVVDVQAYPGRGFAGRITYVSDTVDPQRRAASARVELDNREGLLRPGMFARVEVRGFASGAAEVPTAAVLARRDQFFVFVRDAAGAYVRREVQLGEQEGQHTTILRGLSPGELVVTAGAILLDAEANESLAR